MYLICTGTSNPVSLHLHITTLALPLPSEYVKGAEDLPETKCQHSLGQGQWAGHWTPTGHFVPVLACLLCWSLVSSLVLGLHTCWTLVTSAIPPTCDSLPDLIPFKMQCSKVHFGAFTPHQIGLRFSFLRCRSRSSQKETNLMKCLQKILCFVLEIE